MGRNGRYKWGNDRYEKRQHSFLFKAFSQDPLKKMEDYGFCHETERERVSLEE
ncbi:hypothetical protein LINPERPRIM_LOCUS5523 [Linum perenne]